MLESVLVSMWYHIKDFFLKAAESPAASDPGDKDLEAFKEIELLYASYLQTPSFDKKDADVFLARTEEILKKYPGSFTENLITIICGRMEEIEDNKEESNKEAACARPLPGHYNLW